tara:strand:+ start:1711 stop:2109 length:399 start_codon:yes stop_codon:yes gene_type:complete
MRDSETLAQSVAIESAAWKLAGPDNEREVVFDIGIDDRYQAAGESGAEIVHNLCARLVGAYRDSGTWVDYVDVGATVIMPSITYDNGRSRLSTMIEYFEREIDTSSQLVPLTGTGVRSLSERALHACAMRIM